MKCNIMGSFNTFDYYVLSNNVISFGKMIIMENIDLSVFDDFYDLSLKFSSNSNFSKR